MESVLIIDDEPVTRIGYETIVSEAGYVVAGSAPSAVAALRAASERAPDLALVDIHLGANADGLWVARELANQFGTRIVFITGTPDERIVGAASLIGASAVLRKPVPPLAIIDALDTAARGESHAV
jgi:DNA-binding NarL/FixJ family response regulator